MRFKRSPLNTQTDHKNAMRSKRIRDKKLAKMVESKKVESKKVESKKVESKVDAASSKSKSKRTRPTSAPATLTGAKALAVYSAHREALLQPRDSLSDLSDLVDSREPLFSADQIAAVALSDYHARQRRTYNDRAAAFVSVCIHTGLVSGVAIANTAVVIEALICSNMFA